VGEAGGIGVTESIGHVVDAESAAEQLLGEVLVRLAEDSPKTRRLLIELTTQGADADAKGFGGRVLAERGARIPQDQVADAPRDASPGVASLE
jgi:hypothetical protein